MNEPIQLREDQRALLVELLERELREMSAEIRHTRTAAFRTELHRRREAIEQLLDVLRNPVAA